MSATEYRRMINAVIITVVATLVINFGSVLGNHFNTKYQVKDNKVEIEKIDKKLELKADQSFVIDKENTLKEDIDELKIAQQKTYDLLWDINNKIKF